MMRLLPVVALLLLGGCQALETASPPASAPVSFGPSQPAGSNEDFIVNVGRRVFFAANSATLDETARVTLDKQAEWLGQYSSYKIKIEGFADDDGGVEANKGLGLRRADAVMAYLGSRGLPQSRMRAKTFGTERPVRACKEPECRSQNRRVVVVLDTELGS